MALHLLSRLETYFLDKKSSLRKFFQNVYIHSWVVKLPALSGPLMLTFSVLLRDLKSSGAQTASFFLVKAILEWEPWRKRNITHLW